MQKLSVQLYHRTNGALRTWSRESYRGAVGWRTAFCARKKTSGTLRGSFAEHSTHVSTSCVAEDLKRMTDARRAHLELIHDWKNLMLQRLVRHFPSSQVHLIANEYDRDLKYMELECTAHRHAQQRQVAE